MSRGKAASPETRAAVVADYAAGKPTKDIVEAYDVAPSSIVNWARAAGVEIRPRHRASVTDGPIAYEGGWEVRGGVSYPLMPERRSA